MTSSLRPLDPVLLRRLEALQLAVRRMRWGSTLGGRYAINRRGSSVEFADYTPYTPGDDIRSIDWNLYARLDRLYVKTYQEEVELSVEVMIDATASMALPTPKKIERAIEIALCLAYVALAGHHRVRMSAVAPGTPHATPWCTRRADLTRMTEWAAHLTGRGAVSMMEWMRRAQAGLRMHGGHAVVITDGLMPPAELFQALHGLLMQRVEMKLIQVLTPQELHPSRIFRGGVLVDSESGRTHELAYGAEELERAMLAHNERLARFCTRNGILFAQHRLDEPLETFALKTLPSRGFFE